MKTSIPETRPKKRVLVADDHPVIRAGMIRLINRQEDMTCCGETGDARSLLGDIGNLNPDVLLLDLQLGDADGLELIKALRAQRGELLILVLSQGEESLFAERALRAGAQGYIMKERPTAELLAGIRTVLQGERYLSWEMTMRLVGKAIQTLPEAPPNMAGLLSDRELHVFQLLGKGLATRTIAEKLNLSPKTIEAHRENIKKKLGVSDQKALIKAATTWVWSNSTPAAPESAPFSRGVSSSSDAR